MSFQIHGVNEIGHRSGIAQASEDVNLPLLQDNSTQAVWQQWAVTYRDVILLDENNHIAAVYNLTTNSLGEPENYFGLRDLILEVAGVDNDTGNPSESTDTGSPTP